MEALTILALGAAVVTVLILSTSPTPPTVIIQIQPQLQDDVGILLTLFFIAAVSLLAVALLG